MTSTVVAPGRSPGYGFVRHENLATPHRAGPRDALSVAEILDLLPQLPAWPARGSGEPGQRLRGAEKILRWLESFPGSGWQERWLNSGIDTRTSWMDDITAGDPRARQTSREEMRTGVVRLLCYQVMLPSYGFLTGYRATRMLADVRAAVSPELFTRVEEAARGRGMAGLRLAEVLNVLTKIVLHTGKELGQVTAEDFFEYRAWHLPLGDGRAGVGVHGAWELLAELGVLHEEVSFRAALRRGQRPTGELVDAYGIVNRPIRDALVRYLEERRPSLDYGYLTSLITYLVGNFWADIERHHPGIDTLHLPAEVAASWKERMRYVVLKDGTKRERRGYLDVLTSVRAMYLDIQEWAIEDPSWAQWAVPSPVRRGETQGMIKQKKADRARMHQRTRERLPHLPVLADAADRHRRDRATLLDKAAHTEVGGALEHDGRLYRRVISKSAAAGGNQDRRR